MLSFLRTGNNITAGGKITGKCYFECTFNSLLQVLNADWMIQFIAFKVTIRQLSIATSGCGVNQVGYVISRLITHRRFRKTRTRLCR